MKVVNLKLEEELHIAFKIKCMKEGSDMQHRLVELIEKHMKEED
jgi:hypothetical protein